MYASLDVSELHWEKFYFVEDILRLQGCATGVFSSEPIVIEEPQLPDYVGQPPFARDRIYEKTPAGVVMGLAWSSQGGNSLYIEAASVERAQGKGSLKTTGRPPFSKRCHALWKNPLMCKRYD